MLNKRYTTQGCIQNYTPPIIVALTVSISFMKESFFPYHLQCIFQGEFLSHSIELTTKLLNNKIKH